MKNKPIKYLCSNLKKFPFYLSVATTSEIFATVGALFISSLIGKTLDLALYPGKVDFDEIFKNLLVIAFVTFLGAIFRFASSFYSAALSYKTESAIRKEMFTKINITSLKQIDSTPHGDIVCRIINDLEVVGEGIFQFFTQVFSGITIAIGSVLFLGVINLSIMSIVLGLTPLLVLTSWLITKLSYKSFRQYANLQGNLLSLSEETISNQPIVNAFDYQDSAIKNFKKTIEKMYKFGVKAQFISSLANPSIRFISWIMYALVGSVSAYILVKYQSITIGNISSILIYTAQYTRPFTDFMGVITEIQSAIASLGRSIELLTKISAQKEDLNGENIDIQKSKIEMKNVYFSYVPGESVIENFTLNINHGEKIALVGPTGCGKSTIINLLMRFYEPTSGSIKIDGMPINKININSLRSMYGMILQDTWLYGASIKDNIAYGKLEATSEKIINAAKLANAHNFIEKLENGYDTILSENGDGISQGQKQLISIARVMLTQPKILLLDEATSNIDTRTELKIQDAFYRIMQGKTCIIVAHRLSTIKNADKIVVMDKGKIIEMGNHKTLLDAKGFYYRLYRAQIPDIID